MSKRIHRRFASRLHPAIPLVLLVLGFGVPRPAHAFPNLGVELTDAILHGIEGILQGIGNLFWELSEIGARFMSWIIVDFNRAVGFYDNPFVQAGWTVVRDVANWFFIILLLTSALATILNVAPRFNARTILPKVVILALLINFSLFFMAFFVNVSQVFITLFVQQGVSPYGDIGLALAQAMRLGDLIPEAEIRENLDTLPEEFLIIGLHVIRIVFALGAAFIFFFLAIMFILRVVFLWIAMILSPLALVANLFPRTQPFFNQWLDNFINWLLFGVVATFFVWLATWLSFYLGTAPAFTATGEQLTIGSGVGMPVLLASTAHLMQYITVFIFLWMSVIFSRKLAGQGATLASRVVMGAAGGAAGAALVSARMGRVAALRSGVTGRVGEFMATKPILRTIPGVKHIGVAATRTQAQYDESDWRKREGRYRGLSTEQLGGLSRSARGRDASVINALLTDRGVNTEPLFQKRTRFFTNFRRNRNLRHAHRAGRLGPLLSREIKNGHTTERELVRILTQAGILHRRDGERPIEALGRFLREYGRGVPDLERIRQILRASEEREGGQRAPQHPPPPTP